MVDLENFFTPFMHKNVKVLIAAFLKKGKISLPHLLPLPSGGKCTKNHFLLKICLLSSPTNDVFLSMSHTIYVSKLISGARRMQKQNKTKQKLDSWEPKR